jgi:two-component system LytT family response regulator
MTKAWPLRACRLRLEPHEDVEIIETCQNGREAIRAIKTHKPDLVFLDIQMPGFDGFSVVQGTDGIEQPLFVFVTAYSDHALRAFEAQAVDYIDEAGGRAAPGRRAGPRAAAPRRQRRQAQEAESCARCWPKSRPRR